MWVSLRSNSELLQSAAATQSPAYLGRPQGPDDVHQPPFILRSYTVDAVWGHHK